MPQSLNQQFPQFKSFLMLNNKYIPIIVLDGTCEFSQGVPNAPGAVGEFVAIPLTVIPLTAPNAPVSGVNLFSAVCRYFERFAVSVRIPCEWRGYDAQHDSAIVLDDIY